MPRCPWCLGDPLYIDYHDCEWGVPVADDETKRSYLERAYNLGRQYA